MIIQGKVKGESIFGGGLFQVSKLVWLSLIIYLLYNIYINISILLTYNPKILFPVAIISSAGLFSLLKKNIFYFFLLVFGFSFFLFGFRSYDIQSRFFELFVGVLSLVLLFKHQADLSFDFRQNSLLPLILLYFCIALFSLLLLPVQDIVAKVHLWGISDFSFYVLNATPGLSEYSVASVNRLALFSLAAILLAYSGNSAEDYFKYIFLGAVWGVLVAAIIGLFEYFNVITLSWYVPGIQNKLHSTFLNRGWYAEYVICLTPLFFFRPCHFSRQRRYIFICSVVVLIIGLSILLAGARSGWILYALILTGSSFLFLRQGNFWQKCFKGIGFSLVAILILVFASIALLTLSERMNNSGAKSPESITAKQEFLQKRLNNLFQTGRIKNWQDTIHILDQNAIFGRGYESFNRQGIILASIPQSSYKKNQQHRGIRDTAHNFYLQLVVSNGLAGLGIWLCVAGSASLVLYNDYRKNGRRESIIILLCLAVFHLYGLTQSMQYVPMIWFLVFLFFGYALMRAKERQMKQHVNGMRVAVALSMFCCLFAIISYSFNIGLQQEAERYGLEVFAVDRDLHRYRGFYKKEFWPNQGGYRWTGRQAELILKEPGRVRINFVCSAPRLTEKPIILNVLLGGVSVDRFTFVQPEKIQRIYRVPISENKNRGILRVQVSRTWNPMKEGLGMDMRNLGVAVGEPEYLGTGSL